nr:MAG TPA: hypothetical protein [Caudoviricetes sp.]
MSHIREIFVLNAANIPYIMKFAAAMRDVFPTITMFTNKPIGRFVLYALMKKVEKRLNAILNFQLPKPLAKLIGKLQCVI